MDPQRFDRLVLALTQTRTRRSLLGLLGALGLTGLRAQEVAGQTCLPNGSRCDPKASSNDCCSGKCSRRRKRCRPAPGQGICTVESEACGGFDTFCDEEGINCLCRVTTGGYSFCGEGGTCFACETDTDCEERFTGRRGDRCVVCPTICSHTNNRACVPECSNPA
jgi:hypothetical protein